MPIVMEQRKGRYCPRVRCDHCQEYIDDVEDGNAEWAIGKESHELLLGGKVFYTHKRCCHPFEAKYSKESVWMADELSAHIGMLCHNTQFSQSQSDRMVESLADMGLTLEFRDDPQ